MANGSLANTSLDAMSGTLDKMFKTVEDFANRGPDNPLTEVDMIKFNMESSRYSAMVSMASGLVKNLTDTEKQVANKM